MTLAFDSIYPFTHHPESPFLNSGYDCHCHILPGLDDGAWDMEEALFLAGWLADHGYQEAVCTLHSTRLYRTL